MNPLVMERIKGSEKPLYELPPAPAAHKPISFTKTPEIQAIVDEKVEQFRAMSPQDQLKEVMKPVSVPSINIPGVTAPKSTATALPKLLLPNSTSKPTLSNPKSASLLSVSRSSSNSSAPKPTYTSTPASISTGGKTYTYGAPGGFKRN